MAKEIYISLCNADCDSVRLDPRWRYCLLVPLLFLMIISILAVHPVPFYDGTTHATPGVANLSTSSITLVSTASDTSVILAPGAGFKLSEVTDTASYSVTTDNFTGYSISIVATDNNQTLVNTENASYTLSSITSPVDQSNFVYTNPALVNHWGIKPNKYYDASSSTTINNTTTILPAPNSTGTLLDVTKAANSTANNYSVAIGAIVDGTKPSGVYSRATTLQVIPNPIYYTLSYDKNTTDTVTDLPDEQTGSTTATKIVMSNNTPKRSGYAFSGWCLGTTSTTDGVDSCSGIVFQPGDDFGIDQMMANVSTVYAMWSVNYYTITYGTTTGISSVSLSGTVCNTALSDGGCNKALTYGQTYNLVATPATGYSFTSWDAGDHGTIADTGATGATTTYTVGAGNNTITPTATINQYTCTKQFRLQNADGTWGNYATETTEQVTYGDTCSYSKTVANYKGSDNGANDSVGTTSGTMTENGLTLQIDMYRNTYTVALTKGTGISAVSATGTGIKSGSGTGSATVYYGGNITIEATLTSVNYNWVNWTGSAIYTDQSKSISDVTSNLSFTANANVCATAGAVYNYNYTGAQQTFTAPCSGYYKLEVWGAQGGSANVYTSGVSHRGGYGGYSVGVLQSTKSDKLYVNVGGAGTQASCPSGACSSASTANGGYNGGGAGKVYYSNQSMSVGSGGGATHIASVSGELKNLSSYKGTLVSNSYYNSSSIFIVAGGGGGGSSYTDSNGSTGGTGGGIKGGTAQQITETDYYATGGTQTAGGYNNKFSTDTNLTGKFGKGADGTTSSGSNYYGGGGGGGFFGGGSSMPESRVTGGGGGSGYIGSSRLLSGGGITKHMVCYSCTTSTTAATRTNSNTNVSATATADYSKTGNGYARITYIGESL